MIKTDKQENTEMMKDSVAHLEKNGFVNIKADIDGFETPKSYLRKGSGAHVTPDIVAERAGLTHYFDLSVKSSKPALLKSKWRFLEVLSRMKNHRFKIITRKGHLRFTNDMLNDLNLKKTPIRI